MQSMSIKARVALALVLLLSLVSAIFMVREIKVSQHHRQKANEKLFQDIENHYQSALEEHLNFLSLTVKTIAHSPGVQAAFAEGDRAYLTDRYDTYFEELNQRHGINQFQFHLPNHRSFLRLHRPDKFGDDLSAFRQTVVTANQTQSLVKGLEVGRAGPGLRVVMPLSYENRHIGTVEFGGSIDTLLTTLQETFDIDYAIGIQQTVFESARRLESSAEDVILDDQVFYAFSNPHTRQVMQSLQGQSELPQQWRHQGKSYYFHAIPITDFSGETVGTLVVTVDRTAELAILTREIRFIVLAAALILAIAIAILLSILGQAFAPIRDIIATTHHVAAGNFNVQLDQHRGDEIGAIQRGLAQILQQLCPAIRQVQDSAADIQQTGGRLSLAASQLAEGVTNQANTTENIATSLTEISAAISENKAHSERAAAISTQASADVAAVDEAMVSTGEVIRQVQAKVSSIDQIARNTHLLAINAAIEAAAAGTHGQGFAVIATDIRRLSEDVQKTAQDITNLVQSSVQIADESSQRLAQLVPNLTESNRLIDEVYRATQQQDIEVQQIMLAMSQLETVIQHNATSSEQLAQMAEQFDHRAVVLKTSVDFFQVGQSQPA